MAQIFLSPKSFLLNNFFSGKIRFNQLLIVKIELYNYKPLKLLLIPISGGGIVV